MLNCKQASALISQAMDAELPLGKRMALKVHLFICHGCSNFTSQIAFLRKVARRHRECRQCENLRLSDGARQRIYHALKNAKTLKNKEVKD